MYLDHFPRLPLIGGSTPLQHLPRLSQYLGREIYFKRDDLTPLAFGGNKLRKLEFLAAQALQEGADMLITAGAIQSNHVRQTAAVAARLGLHCLALLENPINSQAENYLHNGNRLLLDLFGAQVEMCQTLDDPPRQLAQLAQQASARGFRPYVIPVGGSNAIGALGYVECAREIVQQSADLPPFSAVVVASGSAGTHAGLLVGFEHWQPGTAVIGVTVSRTVAQQLPVVDNLRHSLADALNIKSRAPVTLWDAYFAPGYGMPNPQGQAAINLLAKQEGILLDPVYTGKAMAGLIDNIQHSHLPEGSVLFIHTGGAPALFAYYP